MAYDPKKAIANYVRSVTGAPASASDDDLINYAHQADPNTMKAITQSAYGPEGFKQSNPFEAGLYSAADSVKAGQQAIGNFLSPAVNAVSGAVKSGLDTPLPSGETLGQTLGANPVVQGLGAINQGIRATAEKAQSGNTQLAGLMAEHGGVAGAAAALPLETLSGMLPKNIPEALLLAAGTPESSLPLSAERTAAQQELKGLLNVKSTLENVPNAAVSGGKENLLNIAKSEGSPTLQAASDFVHSGGETPSWTGIKMPEVVGKNPGKQFSDYLDQQIAEVKSKATPSSSSPIEDLYTRIKGGAAKSVEERTKSLLAGAPNLGETNAAKLAKNPDLVFTAPSMEEAASMYDTLGQKYGIKPGSQDIVDRALAIGDAETNPAKVGQDAYKSLKNTEITNTEQLQEAVTGRQAISEALKKKWYNPHEFKYDEKVLLKMQEHLDNKIDAFDPAFTEARQAWNDAATVEKLNSYLPRNKNGTVNRLQVAAVLHAAVYSTPAAVAAAVASSPKFWKGVLGTQSMLGADLAAGAGSRATMMKGLAEFGAKSPATIPLLTKNSKNEEK
jgi:hypothetical protein